jgi:tRNA (guanine-N7-)-methyltransferase
MMSLDKKALFFNIEIVNGMPLDFHKIFGNERAITIEIGTGKGEFMAVHSRFSPERNFIGIELRQKRITTTLKKLDIEKNSNVRLLNLYVDKDITNYIAPSSIDEFIIYHPDPWPKKRHHKRRMFQHDFLDSINLVLKIGGYVRISTDNPEYAEQIVELFSQRKDFESMYKNGVSLIVPEDHFTTYFDDLQETKGYEPCFMLYKRVRGVHYAYQTHLERDFQRYQQTLL